MKLKFFLLTLTHCLLFVSCQKQKETNAATPIKKEKDTIDLTAIVDTTATMRQDTNRIASDPFRSGDYIFAATAEVFRERFNNYVNKSGWNIHLERGKTITIEGDTICKMPINERINIAAKLNKKGEVVKVVLFSSYDFDVPSEMKVVHTMKGMIASGPAHRYITNDEIETIMYGLGTLADNRIEPKGIYHRDGIRYEVKVNLNNIYFGVCTE